MSEETPEPKGGIPIPPIPPKSTYRIPSVFGADDVTPAMLFKELAENPELLHGKNHAYTKCVVILLDDSTKTSHGIRYGAEVRVAGMDSPQIISALEYAKLVVLKDLIDGNYEDIED